MLLVTTTLRTLKWQIFEPSIEFYFSLSGLCVGYQGLQGTSHLLLILVFILSSQQDTYVMCQVV